jgi:FHA domain
METVSSWRASYVPGRWVVLAGPTSVVIMQPAPAHMSGLLSDLWQDVVSAADVGDLAQKFSAFRLDLMPHFAAFFWAEDGMHSLIRGGLRAVDAETGDVVAEGEGFHTWNEVGLQSVRQVRVDMDELDDEPVLQLPLAVGVVLAASITIDATQKVQLVLPTAAAEVEVPEGPAEPADDEAHDAPVEAVEEPAAESVDDEAVAEEPAAEEPLVDEPAVEEPAAEDDVEEPTADEDAQRHGESPVLAAGLALAGAAAVGPAITAPLAFHAGEPALPESPEPSDQEADVLPAEDADVLPAEDADVLPAEDADVLPPEDAEQFVAEQSLPIETDDHQPEDENSHETSAPGEPSWPASPEPVGHPDGDAWGIRDQESVVPVDLFVDEDGDGVPDAQQGGLDLGSEPADAPAESVALEVEAPEAPQAEGFPGFPGADVAQHQGGFLASAVPAPSGAAQAPQGPPPGWNQPQQAPYAQPQPNPYGPPQGQVPGMPFAVPSASPYAAPQAPSYPGQAYPGQPFPGQPFPGQALQSQPGQYGLPQQPIYPPSPQYGGPMTSPVPPPAAYAPAAPPPQGPGAPSEPGLPVSADSADSDSTVFSTGIAMTHKPVAPRQGSDNLVLAVVCSFGHPNPPGSPRCRRCGQPVDNANPRLVHKPVMALLITAGGARIELTDTVLIGRAPSAQAGDGNPILLPIPSPNSDISRTHLKVAVKEWDIVATDLHSTNGTMLVRPGQAPVRMMPGTPVTVEPGTILDLGDGGVITVGLPA